MKHIVITYRLSSVRKQHPRIRTGGITPSDCAGSGIVKEDDITYKFQTADIFDIVSADDESDETGNDSAN